MSNARVFWVAAILSCAGALAFAQAEPAGGPETYDAERQGLYLAFPAYLFGDASVSGIQAGFQLKNLQLRLDALIASGVRNGDMFLFATPALGFYYSEEWESRIRTYQGISVGAEIGIIDSFGGVNAYANLLAGIEWYVFKNKAFFFEVGTGIGYPAIEGAFNGGTVIGGGLKIFL
jgi:hypothetical protein